MLMIDTSQTQEKLQGLRSLGVSLSLDDFGTGYSSLAYLSRLPVQELKVDQSFVRRMHDTASDTAVVNTIIAMAQELGLELVAEGVETEVQQAHLIRRGCTTIQGFLHSRPVPADQLAAFVNNRGNGAEQV
jgi:EAL domain-containing protein (putative c-di-GMP-specific phosphodiesterase class I)